MAARSRGSSASMKCSVDVRTRMKRGAILPLMSSITATVIGWISLEKTVRSTGRPLSRTRKSSRVRFVASRPAPSLTVA